MRRRARRLARARRVRPRPLHLVCRPLPATLPAPLPQVLAQIRKSSDDLFLIVLRDPLAMPVIAQGLGLGAGGGDLQDMEL